ncbi:antibiotic biosynthesis monooxygenase [Roseibium sp. M-1]
MSAETTSQSIYRVDSFEVPLQSRDALLERLTIIRGFLQDIEGCLQNLVLEQPASAETAKFVTFVEWRNEDVFRAAKMRMAEEYRKADFNPQAFLKQIGAKAVMGNFAAV